MTPAIISVAPMMGWTDRHCRYFMRLLSRHVQLYSEMVVATALLHAGANRFLTFNESEHPLVLQLGGSVAKELAQCAKIGQQYGYDEINFNVGCPSSRVKSGHFGACLMAEPQLVVDCVKAMQDAVSIPVTVKMRTGIDDRDSYQHLADFIAALVAANCQTVIVHARKAWLQGLSPKQNREIPPLHYDRVCRLKHDFPQLTVIINGGIDSTAAIVRHLQTVDGVMIGREVYHNPYFLANFDQLFYNSTAPVLNHFEVLQQFYPYVEEQLAVGVPLRRLVQPILGLFRGETGARRWRRYLSEGMNQTGADFSLLLKAEQVLKSQPLDEESLRA